MMIIVIGGIKGGTGKTTLATNLAVINQSFGRKTLLIDADDQGSTLDWADQRENHKANDFDIKFPTIALRGKNIFQQIDKLKLEYDDIFIDTGGRDTVNQRSALTVADRYLIPFRPRSFDIWTLGKVIDIIDEIKSINPKLKIIVCLNQADPIGKDNKDALTILAEIPEFKCATTFIGLRKAFSNAGALGRGVIEIDKDMKAIVEILLLHKTIFA